MTSEIEVINSNRTFHLFGLGRNAGVCGAGGVTACEPHVHAPMKGEGGLLEGMDCVVTSICQVGRRVS